MPQENKINLSIVIPVFNEVNYIEKLFNELIVYFNETSVEIIFIDDGSNDGSLKRLENLKESKEYNFVFKIIRFDINFGKGKAIQIGIKNSNGEYISQDADLELDTKDAYEMYKMILNNKKSNVYLEVDISQEN